MKIRVFGRTSLLIAISGIAGFLAGRSSNPVTASKIDPLSSRPASSLLISPGPLPQKINAGEKPGAVPSGGNPSRELEEKLSWILSQMGEKRDSGKVGGDLANWFAANPDEALSYLASSPQRDEIFSQLFALWSKKDSHAASLWLSEHPEVPGRDGMAAGLAAGVAREDPVAAMVWVAAIKNPVIKLKAGREAGWVIYRSSEEDAEAGLRRAGIPESAIPPMKDAWQKQFSATVSRNTQNLVSIASAASAAGATMNATNVEDLVSRISTGVSGGGQFKGSMFMVDTSDWTSRELSASKKLITVTDGSVRFEPPCPDWWEVRGIRSGF